jgi:glycerophosphoryl diester phosphodiesterase
MFKLGVLLLGLMLCTGCTVTAPATTPPSPGTTTSTIPSSSAGTSIPTPSAGAFTLVAHRGGALVYPESSAEAFAAVGKTAFPIETDLRRIQDGTLVPLHDDTVDRTMTGISGRPAGLSLAQWTAARIRHPLGGAAGTPTTWAAMLDAYGGRNVLVPEVKDPDLDLAAFADTILSRGVQDTVIVQTFSFTAAQSLARSGLHVLYLLREGDEPAAGAIRAAGIDHVGPHQSVGGAYLRTLKDAGLTVWPYTVNDESTASRLRRDGADGVFTDSPWELAGQLHLE